PDRSGTHVGTGSGAIPVTAPDGEPCRRGRLPSDARRRIVLLDRSGCPDRRDDRGGARFEPPPRRARRGHLRGPAPLRVRNLSPVLPAPAGSEPDTAL